MISVWAIAGAFTVCALIKRKHTYYILAFMSIVNAVLDHWTRADDIYLLVYYSTLDFICFTAILAFGDIHKLRQLSLLAFMVLAHWLMEIALDFDIIPLIESNSYVVTITILTLSQLAGATMNVGDTKTIRWGINNRKPASNNRDFDNPDYCKAS